MSPLRVAVVGSGPAGLYTAEALIKQAAALPEPASIRVDVLDRLPTPYGLVRYGVAPDHKSIKSIAEYLRKVLEHPDVAFLGGVHLGDDISRDDLLACYDAVVYATGAMRDRQLRIPGEDLPGSYAATDFVNWYCGHPDMDPAAFTLDAESVAVIGVGNVAVDVARILVRDPEELRGTDVPQPVLEALMNSKVREVHMIGRRGPAQAKFTTKELRELGELPGVDVIVPATEADLGAFDPTGASAELATSDRHVRGNYTVISGWAGRQPSGQGRKLTLRFWLRPVEIRGDGQVGQLILERTRLDETGSFTGTGDLETLDTTMVLRSVGYQSVPLAGVPFDERSATVPNTEGRVTGPDGTPLPGEYVAGWLKRGPTGVIGTNKSDAAQTVRALLEDLAGGPGPGDSSLPRPGLLRLPKPAQPPSAAQPTPAWSTSAAASAAQPTPAEPASAPASAAQPTPAGPASAPASAAQPTLVGLAPASAASASAVANAAPDGAAEASTAQDSTAQDSTAQDSAPGGLAALLSERGVRPVAYTDWLRIEAAETALGESLGRGTRVKLAGAAAIQAACFPEEPSTS